MQGDTRVHDNVQENTSLLKQMRDMYQRIQGIPEYTRAISEKQLPCKENIKVTKVYKQ